MARIASAVAAVAPYLVLEIVMPGGTLMALMLYLHRRRAATAKPLIQPQA